MITFVYPTEANRDDVQRFYAEFEQQGKTCIGYGKHKNYDTWLTNVHNRIMATDLPEGFVQEAFYLCYDGSEMVGVLNLKFTLTEYLLNYGGHVGYAVKPSRQGHGLATQMMHHALTSHAAFGWTGSCWFAMMTTTLLKKSSCATAASTRIPVTIPRKP